ncbi:hypothetical protein F8388_014051 [Cannabis sativa]|uniref:FAR1 domain-containing protein n=1 Tax=Cannabis sativa TaxID=3483 RepID=A0A7J6GKY0_CANSA|nr:hypothetical protein F8388_014051 [Cannabis sativa]
MLLNHSNALALLPKTPFRDMAVTLMLIHQMLDIDLASYPKREGIHDSRQLLKTVVKLDREDVEGKEMNTLDQWELFYQTYSKWKGFSVWIEKTRYRKDLVNIRRFIEKKRPKKITCVGCKARIRVNNLVGINKWICTIFIATHNHERATLDSISFLHLHREVPMMWLNT